MEQSCLATWASFDRTSSTINEKRSCNKTTTITSHATVVNRRRGTIETKVLNIGFTLSLNAPERNELFGGKCGWMYCQRRFNNAPHYADSKRLPIEQSVSFVNWCR